MRSPASPAILEKVRSEISVGYRRWSTTPSAVSSSSQKSMYASSRITSGGSSPRASRKRSSGRRRTMVAAGLCGVQMITHFVRGVTRREHVVEILLVALERAPHDGGARQGRLGAVGLEGRVGDHDLVARVERRARQHAEQLVGAVAEHDGLGRRAEPLAERLPHLRAAAVRVEMGARRLPPDRLDHPRGGAEWRSRSRTGAASRPVRARAPAPRGICPRRTGRRGRAHHARAVA